MAKRSLSATHVAGLKAPGTHWVAPNLYLQIRDHGTRSWLFRYQRDGRVRWLGLGASRIVSLSEARDKAMRMHIKVRDGIDPVAEKRAQRDEVRQATTTMPTFEWCAQEFIAAHEAGWKNAKHRDQWESTIRMYANPVIGKLPVDKVEIDHVLKILKPIWTTKPETASRLRGRIEKVLGYATAMKYRSGDNPAAWKGALSHLLPALSKVQKIEHHKAVPYAEVPALMADLRKLDSTSAKALTLTVLTGARTGEIINATWPEFDLGARLWIIPAERMKAGAEHRVPLSDAAMELLSSLPRKDALLFPGQRRGRPISNMTMLGVLRSIRGQGDTVHGFRSALSTWAREQTDYPREVIESCLAHAVGSAVEQAYARTDYFDKRRGLMGDWGRYCAAGGS